MTIGLEALGLMALRRLDPERAHAIALMALRRGFAPRVAAPTAPGLATRIFGLDLPTPVGAAAGFDKNAVAPDAILSRGFGFMEVGAVTPLPQRGNPRPRLFRLNEDQAAINRFGFNNDGLDLIARRLGARTEPVDRVWANIGANKDAADRVEDFVTVLRGLHGRVGAATINISSPNTERLRDLQGCAALDALLARVIAARDALAAEDGRRTPLLLKVSPDLDEREIAEIAEVALERGIDGIVATNTTVGGRDALRSPARMEAGGLSGAPLFERSTAVLAAFAGRLNGRIPLVGVGGISSAEQAYAKIRAGASVVQVYTGMIYGGVSLGARIADGLAELARRDGFASVAEAVGTGLSPKAAASP